MQISVLIPTWKRKERLEKCLTHLCDQEQTPNKVYIVTRDCDHESINVVQDFSKKLPIEHILVHRPGVIHAENEGIKRVKEDIVCFLDDDAYVPKDWLKNIKNHFEKDKHIIGVGGPDVIIRQLKDNYRKAVKTVGKLTWYGNPIGNHHHQVDRIHEVDILKGVNMSFKREFISLLDPNLQSDITEGNGSFWELDLCLSMKNKGKLIFDPALEVLHDSDHGHFIEDKVIYNNSRNYTYVMMKHLNIHQKLIFLSYIVIVGNTNTWGFLKFVQQILKGNKKSLKQYCLSLKGFIRGMRIENK